MKKAMKTIFKAMLVAVFCLGVPSVAGAQNDSVSQVRLETVPALPAADSVMLAPAPIQPADTISPADTAVQLPTIAAPSAPVEEQNVYGSTQYYNYEDDPDYYRRPKNPYRTFGHNFNKLFVEGTILVSSYLDLAFGTHVSYVPQQWGGYVAVMNTINSYPSEVLLSPSDWYSVGATFRCSDPRKSSDTQLFGGLMFHEGAGCEFGMRYAADNIFGNRGFSWWGLSFSVGYVNHTSFLSIGLSLGFLATGALGGLFF